MKKPPLREQSKTKRGRKKGKIAIEIKIRKKGERANTEAI